jgi:hypothetical protein
MANTGTFTNRRQSERNVPRTMLKNGFYDSALRILVTVCAVAFAAVTLHASHGIPVVQLSYADGFDAACSQ